MADDPRKGDDMLEDFFEAARAEARRPAPAPLVARVVADAVREAPAPRAARRPSLGNRRRRLLDTLGGWPSAAGLAAATLAGFWLGFSAPAAVEPVSTLLHGAADIDVAALLPSDYLTTADEG